MKSIAGYPVHPAANFFPMMAGDELAELVEDIRAKGLLEKIVLFEGKILDGRNRAKACAKAKVKPATRVYKGKDPVGYVISLNLKRRHLDESQRAMVASAIADATHGGDRRSSGKVAFRTQAQAAKLMNTSSRLLRQAKQVRKHAEPELVEAVTAGHVAVSLAEKITSFTPAQQRSVAAKATKGEQAGPLVREMNRQAREKQMTAISKGNKKLATSKQYGVIYADPPWMYKEGTTTPNRRIDNHYPPMTLEEICELPVRKLALKTCVLAMWVPAPLILEVVPAVLDAWEFEYKSQWIWWKQSRKRATGYWGQMEHEILIIASRGNAPPPVVKFRFPSVVKAPLGKHSEKPPVFRERIEAMYSKATRIELFARTAPKGWDCWGNQAD